MAILVADVMRELNNYFERWRYDGEITVTEDSVEAPDALPSGAWIAIEGSDFNDGVHHLVEGEALIPETFKGRVWRLAPPAGFLRLCDEIVAYDVKNPAGALLSESFGGYAYTRPSGARGAQTWQEAFSARLTPYRHMYTEVSV